MFEKSEMKRKIIISILNSSPEALTINQINNEYKKQTGEKLASTREVARGQLARMQNIQMNENGYYTDSVKCRHVTMNNLNKWKVEIKVLYQKCSKFEPSKWWLR